MRAIVTSCAAVVLSGAVAACSSQTASGTLPNQSSSLSQRSGGYEVIRSFRGGDYGAQPGTLVMMNGTLYGTTGQGGGSGGLGWGTVFSANKSGNGRVLYRFAGGHDGWSPTSLIAAHGTLYGTTYYGGASGSYGLGYGTFFSVSPSGVHRVVYQFAGGADGAHPVGNPTVVDGVFYGATAMYGANGAGTVYAIDGSGKETVLYSFKGGADGAFPSAAPTYLNGALYGVTSDGGGGSCDQQRGCGTIFKIGTSGSEKVLYAFKGGRNGEYPVGELVVVGGKLYGTTAHGSPARNACGADGCGTIFEATTSGNVRVLYRFKGGPSDGAHPLGELTFLHGTLYGTTAEGGNGSGTLFSVTTAGEEHVLHAFAGRPDGGAPSGGLLAVNNALYGETYSGGAHNAGTLFTLSP